MKNEIKKVLIIIKSEINLKAEGWGQIATSLKIKSC